MSNPEISNVDRFKLETVFGNGSVTHTTYATDVAPSQTRATWTDKQILGSGGFGVVILQEARTGELRAVKKIYTGTGQMDFSREVSVMAKVAHVYKDSNYHALVQGSANTHGHQRHDLFVQFLGWYENTDFVFIAMEYIMHGDLTHYLKNSGPCSTRNARAITRQLLEGLATLHELDIAHRDIKPQNVLIASPDPIWVKIADFGVSKEIIGTMLHTRIRSHGYVAPEILGLLPGRNLTNNYTNAVDMWALGCVVHELLTGQIPFKEMEYEAGGGTTVFDLGSDEPMGSQTDMSALKYFCDGKTAFPRDILIQSGVSEMAIGFLNTVLVANPEYRVTANGALGSAWLDTEQEEEVEVEEEQEEYRLNISLENSSINTNQPSTGLSTSQSDLVINKSQHLGLPLQPSKVPMTTQESLVLARLVSCSPGSVMRT